MEMHSQRNEKCFSAEVEALEAQIREAYGRVAYSHKTHEKCADIYYSRLRVIKTLQIILSAITTGGLIASLLGNDSRATLISTVTSTILLALTTYVKETEIGELANKHSRTAVALWDIRESYLSLLADLSGGNINIEEIRAKRDEIQRRLKEVYECAPRTIPKAYTQARQALKLAEELTFSDDEIDRLLPVRFRKKQTVMTKKA